MAALYVDLDADGHIQRPRDTTADDASRAIERGLAASRLLHTVLDPVTPEILDALPTVLKTLEGRLAASSMKRTPRAPFLSFARLWPPRHPETPQSWKSCWTTPSPDCEPRTVPGPTYADAVGTGTMVLAPQEP